MDPKKVDSEILSYFDRIRLKIYSHLADKERLPSDYETSTTHMLYYPDKGGFEVKTPITDWYDQYQSSSKIKLPRLSEFIDPDETTYSHYVKQQKQKENFLDKEFKFITETAYDAALDPDWVKTLAQVVSPLRYLWHGFQMISSYLGSMVPEGRIAIVFAFQSMDEMRRIQRIAYRIRQLQNTRPNFGEDGGDAWQRQVHWQPLRRGIEYLLTTYDWVESFVALNFCFKWLLDHFILIDFSMIAKNNGDPHLEVMFHSFWEDVQRQRNCSFQLLKLILDESAENKKTIEKFFAHWLTLVIPAIEALVPLCSSEKDHIDLLKNYVNELEKHDINIIIPKRSK